MPIQTTAASKDIKNTLLNFNNFRPEAKIKIYKKDKSKSSSQRADQPPFKFNITSIDNQFWKLSQSKKYEKYNFKKVESVYPKKFNATIDNNYHDFLKKRVHLLEQTCQEMRDSNDVFANILALNLTETDNFYHLKTKFGRTFGFLVDDSEKSKRNDGWKRRTLRTWRQSQRPAEKYNKLWSACLPAKHGTSSWQGLLINAAFNRSTEVFNEYNNNKVFYRALPNFDHSWTVYNNQNFASQIEGLIKKIESKDTTFILARHPLDRLYSAWGDKFRETKEHWGMVHHYVYRIRSMEEFSDFKPPGYYVSFQDFIKWYIKAVKTHIFNEKSINYIDNNKPDYNQWFFDHHWRNQISECLPCSIKLDYIVKTETATEDSYFMLDKIYPNVVTEITKKHNYSLGKSLEEINKLLDKVPFESRFRASTHKYEAYILPEEYIKD